MTRGEAIDFLECRRAYYASLSTDPNPNVKATKVCGYTLAESANACLMGIEALKRKPCYTDAEIQKMQELEQAEIEKAYELGKASQPKIGHWIHFATSDDCSECGWSTGKYISPSKYCPNCGAKMESES